MEGKYWYKSWTVWFNIILILTATVQEISKMVPLPPEFLVYITLLGNLILRIVKTKNPIDLGDGEFPAK